MTTRSLNSANLTVYALLVGAALTFATLLVWSPMASWVALVVVLVGVLAFVTPRPEVVFLGLFLVFQDPLQLLVGLETDAALAIKRADEVFILLVGAGCLLAPAVRRAMLRPALVVPLTVCYAGMVLSTLGSSVAPQLAAIDLALFSKPFLLLVIGISLTPAPQRIEPLTRGVLAVLGVVLAVAVMFVLVPDLQRSYLAGFRDISVRLGLNSAQGFFLDPNGFSFIAVAAFIFAYASFLAWGRRVYLVYACAAGLLVLLSMRRKSIVALLVLLAVSVLVSRFRGSRGRAFLLAVLVAVLLATVLAPYFQAMTIKTFEEYGGEDPYGTARSALYYGSVQIAKDHFPLGTGLASFGSHASIMEYSEVYRQYGLAEVWGLSPRFSGFATDTYWPMVLGQGGGVSLLAYLVFLFVLGRATLRALRAEHVSPRIRFLALVGAFLLIASFVESFASHIYGYSLKAALIFVPLGMFWRASIDDGTGGVIAQADD